MSKTTYGSSLFALVLTFLGAACDTTIEPPPVIEDEVLYFPVRVGTTWTYAYRKEREDEAFGGRDITEGILTWTVADSVASQGWIQLEIHEDFEGTTSHRRGDGHTTEDSAAWSDSFRAILAERVLHLSRYTDELPQIQWKYPPETQDTVTVDTLLFAGFGRMTGKTMTLVREVGVTYWWDGTSGRGANYESIRRLER
ncbi:MAG: hypothetical protein ACE5G0_16205 [Rhodothermales bacterium]